MNKIKDFILTNSINDLGILLFSKTDAIKFVEICQEQNIEIFGIDGFWLTDKTIPSMENSVDFSSKYFLDLVSTKKVSSNLYEFAKDFLNSRTNEMYFEIVYNE